MLPAFQDLDLLGGVRDVCAQGLGPNARVRPARARRTFWKRFADRH